MTINERTTPRIQRQTAHVAQNRATHAELTDLSLLDDAAQRLGTSGHALFEYFSRLDALRDVADSIGHAPLAERAARAELDTRIVLSAGLDALNEMHDLGVMRHAMHTVIKTPAIINDISLQDAMRRAEMVLTERYPHQEWGWLERGRSLLADVVVRVEPDGDALRATMTRSGQSTVVSLSPDSGTRIDIPAFFSAGPDRVYATTTGALSLTTEPAAVFGASDDAPASGAYDSAIDSLAFAREWVYRHARNAAEVGAPARTGAGPAVIVIVIIVAAIEFYVCKHDHDQAACKWSEILGTLGLVLLGSANAGNGGSRSNSGGTDPYFQYGTNTPQ